MRKAMFGACWKVCAMAVSGFVILSILSGLSAQASPKPSGKRNAAQPSASNHKEPKPVAQPSAPNHKEEKKSDAGRHKEEKERAVPSAVQIRVVSHNIEKDLPSPSALDQAVQKASDSDADFIALQEVCPSQYEGLKAQVQRQNWTIDYVEQSNPTRNGCNGAIPRVVIVWRGGSKGETKAFTNLTGIPGAPGNGMVCVKVNKHDVMVHACSVHLASTDWKSPESVLHQGSDLRMAAITTIKQKAREWIQQGDFVVIAGDFNANPSRLEMSKMYDPRIPGAQRGLEGDFTEYNRDSPNTREGKWTANPPPQPADPQDPNYDPNNPPMKDPPPKKIDYIFFSTNRAPLYADSFQQPQATGSDHRMITSTAQMSLKMLK